MLWNITASTCSLLLLLCVLGNGWRSRVCPSNLISFSKSQFKIPYFIKIFQIFCLEYSNNSDSCKEAIGNRGWWAPRTSLLSVRPSHNSSLGPQNSQRHLIPLPTLYSRILDKEKKDAYLICSSYLSFSEIQDIAGFPRCDCSSRSHCLQHIYTFTKTRAKEQATPEMCSVCRKSSRYTFMKRNKTYLFFSSEVASMSLNSPAICTIP